jgi:SAM-dependent methyltransferase
MNQVDIDRKNRDFWNELCGSGFARYLGIVDHSPESLARFDAAYLAYYPYLVKHLRPAEMIGKRVLEVGLGYGTVGQYLAAAGAEYVGLDIAPMPVEMMNTRLRLLGKPESARQGSILDCPFEDESFDFVVSIGCFHHTGNLRRAIDETCRVLRRGGTAVIMVYNQFSLRQWRQWPRATLRRLLAGPRPSPADQAADGRQRGAYDQDQSGAAAPETVFTSVAELRRMCAKFARFRCWKENCDDVMVRGKVLVSRMRALPYVGRLCGLDLYARATR